VRACVRACVYVRMYARGEVLVHTSSTCPPHRRESKINSQYVSTGLPNVPAFHRCGLLRTACATTRRIAPGSPPPGVAAPPRRNSTA
jgi:hypothetical protein